MTNQRDYILVVNDRLHCFPLIYLSVTPPRVADISFGEMSYHFFKGCKFRCETCSHLKVTCNACNDQQCVYAAMEKRSYFEFLCFDVSSEPVWHKSKDARVLTWYCKPMRHLLC